MKITFLVAGLITVLYSVTPKPEYQLGFRVQELSAALLNDRSQQVYRLFVPVFRQEVDFARFDSAVRAWQRGRRIARIKNRVVETKGLGASVSSYVFFQGERDYEYLYESWVFTDSGWELTWISNILDQTFQYGQSDTVAMRQVAKRGLEFLLSPEGMSWFRMRRVNLPETVVVVQHQRLEEEGWSLANRTVLWRTPAEIVAGVFLPGMPFYCEFGVVRVLGSVALVALDLKPWPYYQGRPVLPRRRGLQVFLKKVKGDWQVHSVGKRW